MLNRSKYIDCLSIVNRSQLLQVDKDPAASVERKVQRTLRKFHHYSIQKAIQLDHHLVGFKAPLS